MHVTWCAHLSWTAHIATRSIGFVCFVLLLTPLTFPPSHHHLLISASVASRSTLPIFLFFSSRQVLLASFLILFKHDSLTDLLFLQPITPSSACATALVCAALLASTPSQCCVSGRVPETRNLLEKLFLNDFSETYPVRSCHGPECTGSKKAVGSYGRSIGVRDQVDPQKSRPRQAMV